jgi:hypothetical protein
VDFEGEVGWNTKEGTSARRFSEWVGRREFDS